MARRMIFSPLPEEPHGNPPALIGFTDPLRTGRLERTVLLVEVTGPPIHWMEPRDLEFNRLSLAVNGSGEAAGLSSGHPGGANVLMGDGLVRFLKDGTGPETLLALLTEAGGEATIAGRTGPAASSATRRTAPTRPGNSDPGTMAVPGSPVRGYGLAGLDNRFERSHR